MIIIAFVLELILAGVMHWLIYGNTSQPRNLLIPTSLQQRVIDIRATTKLHLLSFVPYSFDVYLWVKWPDSIWHLWPSPTNLLYSTIERYKLHLDAYILFNM